jgi:hypothetical protein
LTPFLDLLTHNRCCVEAGYFRSNFLVGKDKGDFPGRIADYDGSAVRKGEELMEWYNGKQPGDIQKGARVIVDTLTEANGKPVPHRLVIGKDCYQSIKQKCEETLKLLEEQKEISCSTDLDDTSY